MIARRALLVFLALAACAQPSSSSDGGHDAGPPLLPNTAGWWRGQVFYEVFVRSFADSTGDGIGDLRGLTSRLDQLNDGDAGSTTALGVDGLWLMPIYPSPSYHGYDVTEYAQVNPAYGSLADLDALLAAAHARGMRVILDFVPNHTSSQHPWFQDAAPDAGHRDWYVWRADAPPWYSGTGNPVWDPGAGGYYYAYFASSMPDLNYRNPATEQAIGDAMRFWLERGVDGFRIDAARYLVESPTQGSDGLADQPETHAVFQRLRRRLAEVNPQVLLVAEAWADLDRVAPYYGAGDEFQLAFSFQLASGLLSAINAGSIDPVVRALASAESLLADKDRGFDAPFLTNHDQERVMRKLQADPARARLAAVTLLALPGTPFLYYGEEIGMQGGPRVDDRDKRTPMRWDSTGPLFGFSGASASWYGPAGEAAGVDVSSQQADPGSLWNRYRRSIALRHAQPALTDGSTTRLTVNGGGTQALGLLRSAGASRVVFVANFGSAGLGPVTIALDGGSATVLDAEGLVGAPGIDGGLLSLDGLAPRGFVFLSVP